MPAPRKNHRKAEEFASFTKIQLFRNLPISVLRALKRNSCIQNVRPQHIFFNSGERGHGLFILEKGAVCTFRTLETKKLLIADLRSPAVFGEMGCVGEGLYHCTAQARTACRIRTISRENLNLLLEQFPILARRLLDLVGERFFHVLMDLEATSYRGLIARVARLLLQNADGSVVRNKSHQEIAEQLNVYRESATHALGELRKAGIILIDRRQIQIVHRGRLERAAHERR